MFLIYIAIPIAIFVAFRMKSEGAHERAIYILAASLILAIILFLPISYNEAYTYMDGRRQELPEFIKMTLISLSVYFSCICAFIFFAFADDAEIEYCAEYDLSIAAAGIIYAFTGLLMFAIFLQGIESGKSEFKAIFVTLAMVPIFIVLIISPLVAIAGGFFFIGGIFSKRVWRKIMGGVESLSIPRNPLEKIDPSTLTADSAQYVAEQIRSEMQQHMQMSTTEAIIRRNRLHAVQSSLEKHHREISRINAEAERRRLAQIEEQSRPERERLEAINALAKGNEALARQLRDVIIQNERNRE